jgi:Cu(I)/Ag(I) efflux system protein CusF
MKSVLNTILAASFLLSLANTTQVFAVTSMAAAEAAVSQGEIKKIDKDSGKLTIKHASNDNGLRRKRQSRTI